ncbi:MAG: hypothetical protein JW940_22190 [Polyangiaceae bacterium]|nr:hypothetical protein [Polyangiaceae bacterium]
MWSASRSAPILATLLVGLPVLAATSRPKTATRAAPKTAAATVAPTRAAVVPASPKLTVKSASILKVRGPQRATQLNKKVAVEGYFANDSIPMVIDDLKRLDVDMPLPEEAYVPIAGQLPPKLHRGDKIKVTATLVQGSQLGGILAREPTAIRLDNAATQLQVVTAAAALNPAIIAALGKGLKVIASKYAVLIAGGANAASNYTRYWNDLSAMYGLLTNRGYAAANIYVVYANGAARDATMPVNYSATHANIATVFTTLAGKMGANDTLYVMLNDHGGGFMNPSVGGYPVGNYSGVLDTTTEEDDPGASEAAVNQDLNGDGDKADSVNFDETLSLWYETMTDDEFVTEVNKITNYGKMIIQMKQCFSGGFVHDLVGPRRIVMASAGAYEPSWSEDTTGNFGEFTYWYISALRGTKVDSGAAVNADTNGDGKVSILEAYNYARTNDSRPETPHFDDSGTLPVRTGAVPSGNDGTLAAATFL